MANLIIKPTAGGSNQLVLQNESGAAALTVSSSGNVTLAGTKNNVGTVTAGTWGVALNDTTNFSGTSLGMLTAKAWVNFNGTSTVAIRDDFNVSSVTDNGTGEYTINIDADMTNQLYCYIGNVGQGGSDPEDRGASIGGNVLRDSFEFHVLNLGGGHYDGVNCCAVVYGSDRVSFSNATNPTP